MMLTWKWIPGMVCQEGHYYPNRTDHTYGVHTINRQDCQMMTCSEGTEGMGAVMIDTFNSTGN